VGIPKGSPRILVVGPAWVGDMIMAQALFKALKQKQPHALVDVLAPDWSRPLLERMPEVNMAISMPLGHGMLKLKTRYQLAQSLKSHQYDHAFVLPNSWKSALIPWWAKIPKRTGWIGEMRFGLLNDCRRLTKSAIPRMVERFATLAYAPRTPITSIEALHPKLRTEPDNIEKALKKFSMTQSQPVLALCPGAEFGPSKRWPEHYYAEVAREKLKQGWSVWLFGSKNDMPVAAQIQIGTKGQCVDLTGRTSLGEAIDLLSLATAVVTNDSGLMHMAAALDKPLVAVYGSTDPGFTPPLHPAARIVRQNLPCSPCFKRECPLGHHECMKTLSPQQVISTLQSLEG
jgi:heptosyltransferase-2